MPILIRIPSLAIIFISLFLLKSQTEILKIPQPLCLIFLLFCIMLLISTVANVMTSKFVENIDRSYPTISLWLYPTLSFVFIATVSFVIIRVGDYIGGRAFWSSSVKLTARDTTSLFVTSFQAMILFITIQFIAAVAKSVNWFIVNSRSHMSIVNKTISGGLKESQLNNTFGAIKQENEGIRELRIKASSFNRKAFSLIFILMLISAFIFIKLNPALILYYRAELQLKTFLNPESAFKTLEHITTKYPNYKYLDTVEYLMAWITDRRIKNYSDALKMYAAFFHKYLNKSPWIDETIANIVRIYSDKIRKPKKVIEWADRHIGKYHNSVFTPQLILYKIRALKALGKNDLAEKLKNKSLIEYNNTKMQVINSEDHLIEQIYFKDAFH